jgi:outer membrane protein assembly factor BamB
MVTSVTYQAESGDGDLDGDFADSPHVYALGGRKVVGAGEKTGNYIVVDASDGTLIRKFRVVPDDCPGHNGLFATSAVADVQTGHDHLPIVFAPGENCALICTGCQNGGSLLPSTGQITAIMPNASGTLWNLVTPCENAMSGVAVANGVVYYAVVGCEGELLAIDARTGASLLGATPTNIGINIGWGVSGPSVSRGRVYVGTGTKFAFQAFSTPASIVALGL